MNILFIVQQIVGISALLIVGRAIVKTVKAMERMSEEEG